MHTNLKQAQLAELVDALDSNSSIERCTSSILVLGTNSGNHLLQEVSGVFFYTGFFSSNFNCSTMNIILKKYDYFLSRNEDQKTIFQSLRKILPYTFSPILYRWLIIS